ncbi:MAG TPA: hypothetical protein VLE89_02685 [Chlamydiales bacterium]|nr:hypothetical protein [Chlamydiales bacterium]
MFPVSEAVAFVSQIPLQNPIDPFPLIGALMVDYIHWEREGKTPALLFKLMETMETIQGIANCPREVQDQIEKILESIPELSPLQNIAGTKVLLQVPEEDMPPKKNILWCWKVQILDEPKLIEDLDRYFQKWKKYGSPKTLISIQLRLNAANKRKDCPPALQEKIKQVAAVIDKKGFLHSNGRGFYETK